MPDPTPLLDVLAWSPDRPYTARTTEWNTGCPVGYFAEIVPADAALAVTLPNGVEGVRCRLITHDAAVLAEESVSWEDTLANLNAAILETAAAGVGSAGASPSWWWLLGLVGLLGFTGARHETRSLAARRRR